MAHSKNDYYTTQNHGNRVAISPPEKITFKLQDFTKDRIYGFNLVLN